MIYIGCDGGLRGGLAAYDPIDNMVETIPMPIIGVKTAKGNKNEYNIPEIISWFKKYEGYVRMVMLERAQAMPGQGVVSMFNIGKNYGIMTGLVAAMGLPYQIVHPKTWQKKMFEGMPHGDTKQASVVTALRLFPNTQFRASDKAGISDGMTDAALIAYYGYLLHK